MGESLTIPVPGGGAMPAWLERPARAPAGVVVLLHEIFGLNRNMQALARWIAALGHVALVPDLWWRQAEGVALDPDAGPPAWERAFALLRGLDEAAAVADLLAALAFARTLPGGNGRVGSVGFCLGGRLAARLAVRSDADCHVSYYGVGIEGMLEELRGLRAPLLLHIAGRDRFVPPAAQRRIIAALQDAPLAEILVHPAAGHAFARAGARSFDARAAAVAHARTEALLVRCLGL
ncbi:dienelactone hydrolase family protein [Falsiroseomonas sp.]|uniref:dienelactone hydrolase family protein n=1 Tax=Falsiroseomonas sp. TaxID=2870721 RepID=UPI003566882A